MCKLILSFLKAIKDPLLDPLHLHLPRDLTTPSPMLWTSASTTYFSTVSELCLWTLWTVQPLMISSFTICCYSCRYQFHVHVVFLMNRKQHVWLDSHLSTPPYQSVHHPVFNSFSIASFNRKVDTFLFSLLFLSCNLNLFSQLLLLHHLICFLVFRDTLILLFQ